METQPQRVVIIRHGKRADKEGESWKDMHTRPWDSPLSVAGSRHVQQVAEVLRSLLRPDFVTYTSPFLRCLQTASLITENQSKVIVDYSFSEVYDQYNAVRYVDSSDIREKQSSSYKSMSAWFWKSRYAVLDESGKKTFRLGGSSTIQQQLCKAQLEHDVSTTGSFPEYEPRGNPFSALMSIPRFSDEFQRLAAETTKDFVIVTHMSGVTSIVNSIFGFVRYYIAPADFVVLERRSGVWRLTKA